MRVNTFHFFFVFLFPLAKTQYTQKTSKNVMYMNLCAGANNPDVCVPQHFSYTILKEFDAPCTDLIWGDTCRAMVLVSDVDMAIGVFFRGPQGTYSSFMSSYQSKLPAMALTAFGTNQGSVGADYNTAFSRLWNAQGLGAFLQQTWANYCDYALVLSGHSIGSCLAQMAAVQLKPMNLWPISSVIYYGYGTPRCGNMDFAATVDQSAGIRYRVNWLTDKVPLYPSTTCTQNANAVFGSGKNCYYHCCQSQWLKSVMPIVGTQTWQACTLAEDTTCLGGTGSNSADHTSYWSTKQSQYDSLTCGSTMTFQPDP